jgi:two-component system sensor histidine kinase MtrB
VAFVVTAGMAAGALAVGTSLFVASYRIRAFHDRAFVDAERIVGRLETDATRTPESVAGGPEVLLVREGGVVATSPDLSLADVPAALRRVVTRRVGTPADATAKVGARTFTVVGIATETTPEAYVFFGRDDLERSVRDFRLGVGVGWIIVVIVAAAAGTAFARRVLRPVSDAADAAGAVAARFLEVTPPAEGDEFTRWTGSFDSLAAALEEKVTALADARDRERRFNADIAHDLRTPLGSVLTAATLLEQHLDDTPEQFHRSIALIVDGARRLRVIADNLLELHRLEAGVETADPDDIDLGALVDAIVRGNGWEDLVTVDAPAGVIAFADSQRVDRVVVNLLANSLRHGGGRARVSVRRDEAHVSMTVADDGPGIPPDSMAHLFDRYYKAPAAGTEGSVGAGLGLAIAWEQTRLLDGELSVTSVVGRGTRFTLRLPRGGDTDPA